MSHYTVLVVVPRDVEDLDEYLDEVMAPYDEALEVAPYVQWTRAEVEKDFAKVSETYRYDSGFNAVKDDLRAFAEWYYGLPCDEEVNVYTTYNPNSKWDWYEVGGRWDGSLLTKTGATVNVAKVGEVDWDALFAQDFATFAVVDKLGKWHEPGKMGWFGISSASEADKAEWTRSYRERFIANLHPEDYVVLVDCHI